MVVIFAEMPFFFFFAESEIFTKNYDFYLYPPFFGPFFGAFLVAIAL